MHLGINFDSSHYHLESGGPAAMKVYQFEKQLFLCIFECLQIIKIVLSSKFGFLFIHMLETGGR